MVRFFLEDLEVFFPYSHVYPEQYAYMRQLKSTLDAKGHGVLEMPTGTGKTVALMALVSSYQLLHPEIEKFFFCTRTTAEMEKALLELKGVLRYRMQELLASGDPRSEKAGVLACALSARRNLCVHPTISREHDRNKIDEDCRQLTAPWVRRRRQGDAEEAPDIETMFEDIENCRLCPWYEALEAEWSVESMPQEVYTIEDLKNYGAVGRNPISEEETTNMRRLQAQDYKRREEDPSYYSTIDLGNDFLNEKPPEHSKRFCSYFASRRLALSASILVLNYQYVLDPRVSQVAFGTGGMNLGKGQILGKKLGGGDGKETCEPWVIVFDEAHNIDNVCIEALSINLTVLDIEKARACTRKLQRLVGQQKVRGQEHLRSEFERLIRGALSGQQDGGASTAGDGETTAAEYETMLAEHMASPLLPSEQTAVMRSLVPGNIRRSELFLMNLHVVVVYLDEYIRQFRVQSEGPLTFLKKLEDKTTIAAVTLQHFYERLKNLFVTLEVTDLQEYTSLVKVADFCTLVSTYWKGFIVIADPYPDGAVISSGVASATGIYDPVLQLYCIDSSLAMGAVMNRFQSVILTSGTISPLYLYPKILGFTPYTLESFPMSLERQCICPLIVSKGSDQTLLSSRYDMRDDESVLLNYGRLLEEFCEIISDGIVCFFTSYTFMKSVISLWYRKGIIAKILQKKLILMEIQNDTINTTLALNTYRKCCDIGRGAVFLSVARGKVSEGIDFNLHYGRCVIMFGIPYQYTLSKTLRARLLYLKENFNIAESEFLSFDAVRSTSQCIGRIIRSKIDYGIIVLADYRYSKQDKKGKLPKWVQDSFAAGGAGTAGLSVDHALQISKQFLYEMSQPFKLGLKTRLDLPALQKLAALIKKKNDEPKVEIKRQVSADDPPPTTPPP